MCGHLVLPKRPAPQSSPAGLALGPEGPLRSVCQGCSRGSAGERPRRGHEAAGQCPCTQPQRLSPRPRVTEACSAHLAGETTGEGEQDMGREPSPRALQGTAQLLATHTQSLV